MNGPVENTEEGHVKIVPYEPCHQPAFKSLNEEWISNYWKMEELDYKVLDHPQEFILDRGGFIFVALFDGAPVGVCALRKPDFPAGVYELTKLAVSPRMQGRKIGITLCEAAIARAVDMGSTKIFLESNTMLEPAIALYRRLGFREVPAFHSEYERCNIQMELKLELS